MSSRKFLCTLSVFIGTIAAMVGSCWIRLPDYIDRFLLPHSTPDAATMILPLWIFLHVLFPAATLYAVGMILYGLWLASSELCAKLRGESAQ